MTTTLVTTVVTLTALPARASFTAAQESALDRGESVCNPMQVTRGGRKYVGGVSYRIVGARADRLSVILRDVARAGEIVPNLVAARLVSVTPGGVARVHFEHSFGPFRGSYTLAMAFSDGGQMGRFWLADGGTGALDDAWGFVRLTPLGNGDRTLVTYAVLFDLGPGLVRALFESRICRLVLDLPSRLGRAALR